MVPFGAVGAPGGYGALAIMATPTHGGVGLQCPGERPIATPTVQQTRAVLTACQHDAPSVLGGSLRLRWVPTRHGRGRQRARPKRHQPTASRHLANHPHLVRSTRS